MKAEYHFIPVALSLLGAFCMPTQVLAQASGDPNNPLTGMLAIHDPSTIIKLKGVYYCYGTTGDATSTDRVHWVQGITPTTPQKWWNDHGYLLHQIAGQTGRWAPDVTLMNGVYYCYYSISAWAPCNTAVGLTTNTTLDPKDPAYKWVDRGMVMDSTTASIGGWGTVMDIDPSTIVDTDGKWYICYGSFRAGTRMAELNPNTGMLVTPPKPIEITNKSGEASAAVHIGNYYYYAVSENKCCKGMQSTYAMYYARASKIGGPYTAKNGGSFVGGSGGTLLLQGSDNPNATSGAVAVGVGGFFWDHIGGAMDTLFLDYMAYTAPSGNALLNIKPLYMDAQGWLTLTPSQGTVITRMPPTTSVQGVTTPPTSAIHVSRNMLHLTLPGWTRAQLDVFDLAGRKVSSSRLSVSDGHSDLDLRALAGAGLRDVRVTGDGGRLSQQVVLP